MGRTNVKRNGLTTSASQVAPVLPEVRAKGRTTKKTPDPITVAPIPNTRKGFHGYLRLRLKSLIFSCSLGLTQGGFSLRGILVGPFGAFREEGSSKGKD